MQICNMITIHAKEEWRGFCYGLVYAIEAIELLEADVTRN